ncbi:hypothetical protein RRF57_000512 [Xylaria bambusicola]|uniref:Uncharacterized protein n=1 Tax=Xylaria bambusicola TaxID=326684 RepID=A0AAN7UFU4_9PEZI
MSTPRNLASNKVLNSDVALHMGSDWFFHTSQVVLALPGVKGFMSIISVNIDVSFGIYATCAAGEHRIPVACSVFELVNSIAFVPVLNWN